MILIDGNAGDGEGSPIPQPYPFENDRIKREVSRPTPQLLSELADKVNATLCLCETIKKKRDLLKARFPKAHVFSNHKEMVKFVIKQRPDYIFWLSDPSGPRGQGMKYMRIIAISFPRSDFLIILNVHGCHRIRGTKHPRLERARRDYLPMLEPDWWRRQLGKSRLLYTSPNRTSNNFGYQLILATNYICDGARRQPDKTII
jgi:hypothetical protein